MTNDQTYLAALMAVLLAVCAFGLPASAQDAPNASYMIGDWTCTPRAGGPSFGWSVTEELPGGWIVARGYENGKLTSLETWSHTEGRLDTRRQFSPEGRFIELRSVEPEGAKIVSIGQALQRDGSIVPLRHSLTRIGDDQLAAVWEADFGNGLDVVADEICDRSK